MPQEFYTDAAVHLADVERIFRRQWVFVGHSCQIIEAGEFFTVTIGSDPLIVIRGDDGIIRALHNVCRHRGTLISREDCGKARRLVCPYHQWTYERDGKLASFRGMHDEINQDELGLLPAHVEDLEGMLFVCLSDPPPDFAAAREAMASVIRPQRMGEAKVAKIVDYDVAANWKLVWENNRECYHCNVNHPQYIKANFDHFNSDDTTLEIKERIDASAARHKLQCTKNELEITHKETGMATFPDPDHGYWYAANRTTLTEGYVSETMDGNQVAPLMGDYTKAVDHYHAIIATESNITIDLEQVAVNVDEFILPVRVAATYQLANAHNKLGLEKLERGAGSGARRGSESGGGPCCALRRGGGDTLKNRRSSRNAKGQSIRY